MPHFPSLRSLLFPPRCAACGELLHPCSAPSEALCPICRAAWETAMAEAAGQAAADAARGTVYLTFYHSGQTNGVPERLIYHMKHRGDPRAFAFVAARLAPRVMTLVGAQTPCADECDTVSPILFTYPPRHPVAIRRDGFDQAARLAQALAKACGGELAPRIRRDRRSKEEQKHLDAAARAENARLAFRLDTSDSRFLHGRTVVVCDDIRTTGATLNRCAELLREAGAVRVISVTVAQTHSP